MIPPDGTQSKKRIIYHSANVQPAREDDDQEDEDEIQILSGIRLL